ncbi:MAG: amidohydrolase family protein [Desulfobacterales bacterium]
MQRGQTGRRVEDFPGLRVCVPHLGFDETEQYRKLIEKYDHLWLDTTMVLADYFPTGQNDERIDLTRYRSDRVMYGSDFPNIPYNWDRELKALTTAGLSPERWKTSPVTPRQVFLKSDYSRTPHYSATLRKALSSSFQISFHRAPHLFYSRALEARQVRLRARRPSPFAHPESNLQTGGLIKFKNFDPVNGYKNTSSFFQAIGGKTGY